MLLRILRRVAYYKIGICYFKSQPLNKDVYAIGWRNRIKPHYACHSFEHAYTEKDAIELRSIAGSISLTMLVLASKQGILKGTTRN